jgi:integrase
MSLLYKRPGSPNWYVTKTRESTKTANRKDAEEFARKSLKEHWRAEALGEERYTWETLADAWLDRKDDRPSAAQDRMVIDRVSDLLKRREVSDLSDITGDLISYYAKVVKASSSPATANRHLTTIRAMLNFAHAKEWIDRVPTIENYQLVKREVRWLTIEEFDRVSVELPRDVCDMATLAVQTGMRMSNVLGLQWAWISADLTMVVVPAVHTKSERTYTVPLSTVAKEVLTRRKARRSDSPLVFALPDGSAPVKRAVRYQWDKAVEAAGLPPTRWHDLRHTWASLHVQNGTPDRFLAQMGGWASTRMLETYAHLNTDHLARYADNLNGGA